MSTGKSIDIPPNDVLTVMRLLKDALGNNAGAVIEKIKTDPAYVTDIVAHAMRRMLLSCSGILVKELDITVCEMSVLQTFVEIAQALPDVEQSSDIVTLGRSLIACGYVITTREAKDTVRLAKGISAFFFTETGDEDNPVSVGYVRDCFHDWYVETDQNCFNFYWHPGSWLLLHGLNVSKFL